MSFTASMGTTQGADGIGAAALKKSKSMGDAPPTHYESGGFVAHGFESVRDLFLKHFKKRGQEESSQFCAYHRGQKVVDLWATRIQQRPGRWGKESASLYSPSSVQNVFSSTKVLTSLVLAMLVDRGHLTYETKVSDIWPEFGCNDKEETTIAMVLRHEAGLATFDVELLATDLTTNAIKENIIGKEIARQKCQTKPGTKRQYHAITRGWILNECVRRVDPKQRTIGEFLKEEVGQPLGIDQELFIGVPVEHHDKVVPLCKRPSRWTYRQIFAPSLLGGGNIPGASVPLRMGLAVLLPYLQLSWKVGSAPTLGVKPNKNSKPGRGLSDAKNYFNTAEFRSAEMPSANGHASARALAKVANAIVERGNTILLSESGKQAANGNPVEMDIYFGKLKSGKKTFVNAGWCHFLQERNGYRGWLGLGGSCLFFHEGAQVACSYCPTALELLPWNPRASDLSDLVLKLAQEFDKEYEPVIQTWRTANPAPEDTAISQV